MNAAQFWGSVAIGALSRLGAALALTLAQPAEAMSYSTYTHNRQLAIIATGSIEFGDAQRFEAFLNAQPEDALVPHRTFVFLDSPGGLIQEALRIGRTIEDRHFLTSAAGAQCSSACVLAWAAGERKYTFNGKCIGVHGSRVDAAFVAKQGHSALEKASRKNLESTADMSMATWLWEHGAPNIVMTKIFKTPNESLYCLTDADLEGWNVRVMP